LFYPNANCQNKGPGNPNTDPNYQRGRNAAVWQGDQTVGVAPRRRARKHTADISHFSELLSDANSS
jgi:hypothetical protein